MTGPEHYEAAEQYADFAEDAVERERAVYYLGLAQVHATLALAAATALPILTVDTRREWIRVADAPQPEAY
jgi:hypothetical protein